MTTMFQRAFLSVIGHYYLKEFKSAKDIVQNKTIQVNKKNRDLAFYFKINELTRLTVNLEEEGHARFKVWSDKVYANGNRITDMQLRTQDDPYTQALHITEIESNYIRGKDVDGHDFEIREDEYYKVQVYAYGEINIRAMYTYYIVI